MKIITKEELEAHMETYLHEISTTSDAVLVLGENEKDTVVLMLQNEYAALKETLHLLSSENNRTRIMEALIQAYTGQGIPYTMD